MGSRNNSSPKANGRGLQAKNNAKAVIVEINGSTLSYRNANGVVTDITGENVQDVGNLTFKDVVDRVSNNQNAKVTYLNAKQVKTYDERRKHNRKIENDYLDNVAGMYQGGVVHKKGGGIKKTKGKNITLEEYVKSRNLKYYDKLY